MKMVKFGMFWQCYGYQTVELPDNIDTEDADAVKAYLESIWEDIPLPEGDYVPESDEFDPESIQIW